MIIQLWNNFSIQHLQWVPWKPCHDVGTAGIFRQSLLDKCPIFLRWPKFETNRNGSRPYWSPSLSLGSELGPSCPTPLSTVCDMITVDLLIVGNRVEDFISNAKRYLSVIRACEVWCFQMKALSPTQFLLCRMRCFAWYCLQQNNMKKRPFNIMIKIDHDKNMLHLHYTG